MIKTKRVLIPFIPAIINRVEAQLSKISLNGWELVSVKGWMFFFKKTSSKKRMYFMYRNFDRSKGISFDYHVAKQKYSKRQSILKSANIFEIDNSKIDSTLYSYIDIRNRYYIKFYLFLSMASLLVEMLFIIISFKYGWWFSAAFLWVVLYSLLSLVVILCDTIYLKKQRKINTEDGSVC